MKMGKKDLLVALIYKFSFALVGIGTKGIVVIA